MNASVDLTALAKNVMQEKGLLPEFSPQVFHELLDLEKIPLPLNVTDLRSLVWCSIDNEDSRDLDQLTAYQSLGEKHQVWVAIADVDSLVKRQTAIDEHAQVNTTSVYTPTKVFSMLPEQLSTNLTSLNEGEDRLAIVFKMVLDKEGEFVELESEIMQALVRNQAKLNYQEVGVWLNVSNTIPSKIQAVKDLEYSFYTTNQFYSYFNKII